MAEKMVFICTHGPENPELATIPFVMATTAQASDVEVLIGFQANAVLLVKKGIAEHVFAANFPPLTDLMAAYREAGGEFYVCGPCVQSRKLDPTNDFIEGAKVVNAATYIKAISDSNNSLVY